MNCTTPDCDRRAKPRGTRCSACYEQFRLTGSYRRTRDRPRHESPLDALLDAVVHMAEAKDKERAWHRLRMAFRRFKKRRVNNLEQPPETTSQG
jgi:hypothetical protein